MIIRRSRKERRASSGSFVIDVVIAFSASALLVACQGAPVAGAVCVRNSECPTSLVCTFGRCRVECVEGRDCPPGSECLLTAAGAGACALPDHDSCEPVHLPCVDGLVCAGTTCRQPCDTFACAPDDVCTQVGSQDVCVDESTDAGVPRDATIDGPLLRDAPQSDVGHVDAGRSCTMHSATLEPSASGIVASALTHRGTRGPHGDAWITGDGNVHYDFEGAAGDLAVTGASRVGVALATPTAAATLYYQVGPDLRRAQSLLPAGSWSNATLSGAVLAQSGGVATFGAEDLVLLGTPGALVLQRYTTATGAVAAAGSAPLLGISAVVHATSYGYVYAQTVGGNCEVFFYAPDLSEHRASVPVLDCTAIDVTELAVGGPEHAMAWTTSAGVVQAAFIDPTSYSLERNLASAIPASPIAIARDDVGGFRIAWVEASWIRSFRLSDNSAGSARILEDDCLSAPGDGMTEYAAFTMDHRGDTGAFTRETRIRWGAPSGGRRVDLPD